MSTAVLAAFFALTTGEITATTSPISVTADGPPRRLCSRQTPPGVERIWTPSADQVRAIDERLAGYLRAGPDCAPSSPLSEYYRRYSGFVRAGRELVYVDAIDRHEFELEDNRRYDGAEKGETPLEKWQSGDFRMCDGGDGFWGVEYDVGSGSFLNLRINYAFDPALDHCHFGDPTPRVPKKKRHPKAAKGAEKR